MKTYFKTNSDTAHKLTKAAKKEGFYFRTLTRTDDTDIVCCETTAPGKQYIEENDIEVEWDNPVLDALMDARRQIDADGWWIPTNDSGSGSAGVNFLKESDPLDAYIRFATGDNTDCPNIVNMEYVPVADFGDAEKEALDEIMQQAHIVNVERDEVLGFIVCHERYDMDYTFYITHIRG